MNHTYIYIYVCIYSVFLFWLFDFSLHVQDAGNITAPAATAVEAEVADTHVDELLDALGMEHEDLPEGDLPETAEQEDEEDALHEKTPEEVSLQNGMGKLQDAMQKRDLAKAAMKRPAAAAALQAKPKLKAMKVVKKPTVMKSHAMKVKAKPSPKKQKMPKAKACPKAKVAPKGKAAPRRLKMTKECVYSRAYHAESSAWASSIVVRSVFVLQPCWFHF